MIVWRITGNEVGHGGNGAAYYATKAEADKAARAARQFVKDTDRHDDISDPEKITVLNREQLAAELNEAMGYGAS